MDMRFRLTRYPDLLLTARIDHVSFALVPSHSIAWQSGPSRWKAMRSEWKSDWNGQSECEFETSMKLGRPTSPVARPTLYKSSKDSQICPVVLHLGKLALRNGILLLETPLCAMRYKMYRDDR